MPIVDLYLDTLTSGSSRYPTLILGCYTGTLCEIFIKGLVDLATLIIYLFFQLRHTGQFININLTLSRPTPISIGVLGGGRNSGRTLLS